MGGLKLTTERVCFRPHPIWVLALAISLVLAACGDWGQKDKVAVRYGEMTDSRDGRAYRTLNVGSMTWMRDNLYFATPSSVCIPSDTNCQFRLYTWSDAMGLDQKSDSVRTGRSDTSGKTRGACPAGWHIPSQKEWGQLCALVTSSRSDKSCEVYSLEDDIDFNLKGWRADGGNSKDGKFWSAVELDSVAATYAYFYTDYDLNTGIHGRLILNQPPIKKTDFSAIRCVQDQ